MCQNSMGWSQVVPKASLSASAHKRCLGQMRPSKKSLRTAGRGCYSLGAGQAPSTPTCPGETRAVQRHGAGFCKSVLGEGAKEVWASAPPAPRTGAPAKHPLSSPRQTVGSPCPSWWQLKAGHRECCWLWAPWVGSECRRGAPLNPWRTPCRLSPCCPEPPYLPLQSHQSRGYC